MSKRQKQFTVSLRPAVGQKSVSAPIRLNGFVKSMGVYTRKTEDKILTNLLESTEPLCFMSLEDDSNSDIVPMISLDNYKPSYGGGYEKSFKPLGFMANNENFKLTLNTERVSTGVSGEDIDVQVVFFVGDAPTTVAPIEIGRASCRERVLMPV